MGLWFLLTTRESKMSENDIVNAIVHRLGMTRMAELVRTYGIYILDMELSMASSF